MRFSRRTQLRTATLLLSAFLATVALASCSAPPDRKAGPLAALDAARFALHRHDIPGFFDAMGDATTAALLKNAVLICLSSNQPIGREMGLEPAPSCFQVLRRSGWPYALGEELSMQRFESGLASIPNVRAVASELESSLRDARTGSSFVWGHLDPIEIKSLTQSGDTATAEVVWSGEPAQLSFYETPSGWRVETLIDMDE
jgi:hypothetical protein